MSTPWQHIISSQPRIAGFLERLAQAPPNSLLLEGGNASERLAFGLFWAARLMCREAAPPCGECRICLQIADDACRDLFLLNGAEGSINVDTVREIRAVLGDPPAGRGPRVVILAEAQALGDGAANALLKSLEEPSPGNVFVLLAPSREILLPTLVSRSFVLTLGWPKGGLEDPDLGERLRALCEFIHRLLDSGICDWILVEADGARGLPLKAPAKHEPVIPERSTHVLALAGLTAIGTALDEDHVCRSGRYAELSGLPPNALVTTESVARVCNHPHGMFKGAPANARRLLWLNQADTPDALAHGREILDRLRAGDCPPRRVVVGAAMRAPCVREVWEP